MDFDLTEKQKRLQDTAYRFAVEEIQPIARACDREERHPKEVWKKASERGLVGVTIPEKYGGPGLGFVGLTLVTEQLSRVDLGMSLVIAAATFGSENIMMYGTEKQKKKYLPLLVNGEAISAGAYTEPDAGTDVASIRTMAVKEGKEYVINGNKIFITNGRVCNWMVVLCVTHPEEEKRYGRHSLILVESDRKGVEASQLKGKLGVRASETTEIAFSDVRVPCENLIGEEGKGFYQLMHFFDATRTMVAAQGVGLAQGALDRTARYIQERKVQNKPLAASQSIQFQLAEMATRIELARNTTYKAAWKVDQGRTDPALNAMAKYFSGEMAVWVCGKALEIHAAFSPEALCDAYDIQRFFRDAKILEIYEGTKEAEKMTISRRLF
ncbi:MAG: acyl-CoA dehydrogenase family protein [Deltaproteobacteria bacterium]|nr:MAG: acyl-CoA dehydrogenase family protein [Deltaproteobacteria bacterium]